MAKLLGALALVLMIGMVLVRVRLMKRHGIKAVKFGAIDKKDFLILPFALFYFYIVFAAAFGSAGTDAQVLFNSPAVSWLGVCFCAAGLSALLLSLVSFGRSFRIGIDTDHPDKLVTTGIFAFSRNPIYVGFAIILIGEFLVFGNWILLAYVAGAFWLFHRQILREEAYLTDRYGQEYLAYCKRARRYL